jgi:signal transduction histidine kinase
VDLAEIIDAAVEVVRPAAAAKHITLTTEIEIRPAITSGDPDRLQQIVWNLVSNAVKFTAAEGATTVRLTRHTGFRIEVIDTGQGIDARFLPHVFDACRQADGTTTREHGGLGLGLAVTADASENDRASALASGYQAHVAKPFEPEELARIVASLRGAQIHPS